MRQEDAGAALHTAVIEVHVLSEKKGAKSLRNRSQYCRLRRRTNLNFESFQPLNGSNVQTVSQTSESLDLFWRKWRRPSNLWQTTLSCQKVLSLTWSIIFISSQIRLWKTKFVMPPRYCPHWCRSAFHTLFDQAQIANMKFNYFIEYFHLISLTAHPQ